MGKHKPQDSAGDHADEHEGGHVIPGLHDKPHGQHSRQEDVGKGNVHPHFFSQDHREIHTKDKGQHCAHQAEHDLLPAAQLQLVLQHAEHNREQDKEQGNTSGRAVYCGVL